MFFCLKIYLENKKLFLKLRKILQRRVSEIKYTNLQEGVDARCQRQLSK